MRPHSGTIWVSNGTFALGLQDWTITDNITYAYGGMAFHSGNLPPNGVGRQTLATQAGLPYTINLQTGGGGNLDVRLRICVQAIVASTTAVLGTADFGKNVTGPINFKAGGANTILQISDISTYTYNTDVSLTNISVSSAIADQSTNENTQLVWSAANGRPLQISDADGTTGTYTLSLSVSHGTLTQGSTNGITVTSGSNGSSSLTINGTQAGINNNALSGLTYAPALNYNGNTGTGEL